MSVESNFRTLLEGYEIFSDKPITKPRFILWVDHPMIKKGWKNYGSVFQPLSSRRTFETLLSVWRNLDTQNSCNLRILTEPRLKITKLWNWMNTTYNLGARSRWETVKNIGWQQFFFDHPLNKTSLNNQDMSTWKYRLKKGISSTNPAHSSNM